MKRNFLKSALLAFVAFSAIHIIVGSESKSTENKIVDLVAREAPISKSVKLIELCNIYNITYEDSIKGDFTRVANLCLGNMPSAIQNEFASAFLASEDLTKNAGNALDYIKKVCSADENKNTQIKELFSSTCAELLTSFDDICDKFTEYQTKAVFLVVLRAFEHGYSRTNILTSLNTLIEKICSGVIPRLYESSDEQHSKVALLNSDNMIFVWYFLNMYFIDLSDIINFGSESELDAFES
ncbi:hypothetical protein FACS1894113_4590 [Alphaproteobacteria bacterium]|nr:hypothetical protein FACS1894113_4590 [Alphaproteobacteria bacterium]